MKVERCVVWRRIFFPINAHAKMRFSNYQSEVSLYGQPTTDFTMVEPAQRLGLAGLFPPLSFASWVSSFWSDLFLFHEVRCDFRGPSTDILFRLFLALPYHQRTWSTSPKLGFFIWMLLSLPVTLSIRIGLDWTGGFLSSPNTTHLSRPRARQRRKRIETSKASWTIERALFHPSPGRVRSPQ